jgi:hypothetical protein
MNRFTWKPSDITITKTEDKAENGGKGSGDSSEIVLVNRKVLELKSNASNSLDTEDNGYNPYRAKDGKFTFGPGTTKEVKFTRGDGDYEITLSAKDVWMTAEARANFNKESRETKTASQLNDYLAKNGIKLTIANSALKSKQDEEIDLVKSQIDSIIVSVEQYKSLYGKESYSSLKEIQFFDSDLDVQAQYNYKAKGEKSSPLHGVIQLSNRVDAYHIMHEFGHVLADSTKPKGKDLVEWSADLNKLAKLPDESTAYFGAKANVLEAERFADALGKGFAFGDKSKLSFASRVANEIKNNNSLEVDNGYNPYRAKDGKFASGPKKSTDSDSKFHNTGDSIAVTEQLGKDYKVSEEVREAHYGDIADYAGGGYDSVNNLLRQGPVDKGSLEDSMTADVIYSMDDAFSGGYQKLKKDTTIFRGMRLTKPLSRGQTIQNKGFMSTSLETGIPRTFARPQSDNQTGYLVRIRAKKGTKVVVPRGYGVGSPLESEIIFNRGSKIKIKSISTESDTGLKLVEASYVE